MDWCSRANGLEHQLPFGRDLVFGSNRGMASSQRLSVNWVCSEPSAFMTKTAAYGWGLFSNSTASSLKPYRALLHITCFPSSVQIACASLPGVFVSCLNGVGRAFLYRKGEFTTWEYPARLDTRMP
jgi:hypothetical protein